MEADATIKLSNAVDDCRYQMEDIGVTVLKRIYDKGKPLCWFVQQILLQIRLKESVIYRYSYLYHISILWTMLEGFHSHDVCMNITFFFPFQNHFFNQKTADPINQNLFLQHEIHSNQSLRPREHHSSAQKTIICTPSSNFFINKKNSLIFSNYGQKNWIFLQKMHYLSDNFWTGVGHTYARV